MVWPELRALDFTKISLFFLVSNIHKSEEILIKLCHNVYGDKVSDEFDYGLDRIYLPLNSLGADGVIPRAFLLREQVVVMQWVFVYINVSHMKHNCVTFIDKGIYVKHKLLIFTNC